jgi:cytochrome c oxidase assembly protein subunit 11
MSDREKQQDRENRSLIKQLVVLTVAMFGFGYLLVPLYDAFCELTGIRTNFTAADPTVAMAVDTDREVTIEFIATPNINAPWSFAPVQAKMKVQPGKLYEATYIATNLTDAAITGNSVPDVKPSQAAKYFRKTECFCFTPQPFTAGQSRELPVRFIVDPDLPPHIETITLSYSLFSIQQAANAAQ